MRDPHRGACLAGAAICASWDKSGKMAYHTSELRWPELLDWAVYHAPEWEQWQEFRQSLIGTPMEDRHLKILAWWNRQHDQPVTDKHYLANVVRVTNLLRSLRGQFSEHPVLREMLEHFNKRLKEVWR